MGAPWTEGNLEVTWTALTTLSCGTALMLTTVGPENTPAGVVSTEVMNMETFRPASTWGRGMPTPIRASSKVKLHPSRNETMSPDQRSATLSSSSTISPLS